jgi:hypothetical protein
MRRMVILLPPPPLKFLPSILCASFSGSIVVAVWMSLLCRLLPLAIDTTFCLPSGQKHNLTPTTFVLPLIERGLKVMVLVGLWLVEALPGLLLEEVEFPGPEEAELVDEVFATNWCTVSFLRSLLLRSVANKALRMSWGFAFQLSHPDFSMSEKQKCHSGSFQ